ncbi:MAG: Smr/MutS family protein [Deltaproteobacteria bacterium]|nr:Smr/MutS family protein [Deltaproteobacteria bacterium]
MPRRRKKRRAVKSEPNKMKPGPLSYSPFEALKGLKIDEKSPEPVPSSSEPPDQQTADFSLFREAVADVTPLSRQKSRLTRGVSDAKPIDSNPLETENLEVLAELEDLVSGRTQFDIVDTDEYIEGYVKGIHPIILEKLKRGFFSVQAYLDLHGLTVREAGEAVKEFIDEAVNLNYRCVLLVHGRGINSKNQLPVLKKRLKSILLKGPARKKILAFTSARPHDGGAGASYVLLRARN